MKTNFKISNLLGTVYCGGDLIFTSDGNSLLSPVGNRIVLFDLIRNICRIALNPQENLVLSIDVDGKAILAHFRSRLALYHFSFQNPVEALSFSAEGKHFAVACGRVAEVWQTPEAPTGDFNRGLDFAPFVLHRTYTGHNEQIQSIEWSSDSRFFLTCSRDLTIRIWSRDPETGFSPTTLAGHRETVIKAWFSANQEGLYSVSADGALVEWIYSPARQTIEQDSDEEDQEAEMDSESETHRTSKWIVHQRHYFMQPNAKVKCADFHPSKNLLVVAFTTGIFALYQMPEFSALGTLSVSQDAIDVVTWNASGEWLALGSAGLGQLLVWEWQSESYIIKQQGHFDAITDVVYTPDGRRIVTTADDGKIKVWDVASGFCIVTFTEHSSCVTACDFAQRGNVLFTSSLDGSVRAWDLLRFRNFRVFTAPTRISFSTVVVDPSGEIVCAGSIDNFDIYVWSVQTGQLLDQMTGHEGPVSTLAFAPAGDTLVSGSWDNSVRIWGLFGRTQTSEPIQLQANVLRVAFCPDSKQIAVSTLDGQLNFWNVSDAVHEAGMDGRRDVSGGRKVSDRRAAANVASTKYFNCVVYSPDGSCVIAGGNSKYVCLYDVHSGTLLRKFTISVNLSLDGTQEYLNSRRLTAAGPEAFLSTGGQDRELENAQARILPGTKRGDTASRSTRRELRVSAVGFNPKGDSFCVASTEGLQIYSLDPTLYFDPFDLDVDITPTSALSAIQQGQNLMALIISFRLNDNNLLLKSFEAVPVKDISLVVQQLPVIYIAKLMSMVTNLLGTRPHIEFNLRWIEALVKIHGRYLKDNASMLTPEARALQKAVAASRQELARIADENLHSLDYLLSRGPRKTSKIELPETLNGIPSNHTNGVIVT